MPRGVPNIKPFLEFGLTEAEAYAVLSALKTTLKAEPRIDKIESFGMFATKLYRKSLQSVIQALETALADDEKQTA
ncbi:hypothetical protein [uncultured Parasutterella sp.]|uniref:hypothetical protein n=1 Tax=uncultured Parasutterella sp. TaxID=1263098 RepID=UPI0025B67FB5|nr:hypothetical protein [uncultured Parasutterella sp.]